MGRRKNLASVLVRGPGIGTIIMMSLIVSVTVWYGLKDHTALLKNSKNNCQEHKVDRNKWSLEAKRYRKWWRSPHKNGRNFERNKSPELAETRRNPTLVRPFTFNSRNSRGRRMELEECGAWCEWRSMTHRGHKRFSEGKCAQLQIQEQNYRFLPTPNQITSNTGNRNMNDLSNMLLTMGIIV